MFNLTNPLADNDYVRKSKDGTELEQTVGKELCHNFIINYKPDSGNELNIPPIPGRDTTKVTIFYKNILEKIEKLKKEGNMNNKDYESIFLIRIS